MRPPRTRKERRRALENGDVLKFLCLLLSVPCDPELESGRMLNTPKEHLSLVKKLRKAILQKWKLNLEERLDKLIADPAERQRALDEVLMGLPVSKVRQ
jgi:hypothetical protein